MGDDVFGTSFSDPGVGLASDFFSAMDRGVGSDFFDSPKASTSSQAKRKSMSSPGNDAKSTPAKRKSMSSPGKPATPDGAAKTGGRRVVITEKTVIKPDGTTSTTRTETTGDGNNCTSAKFER